MNRHFATLAIVAVCCASVCKAAEEIGRIEDLRRITMRDITSSGVRFSFDAWIVCPGNARNSAVFIEDASGAAVVQNHLVDSNATFRAGDRVQIEGAIVNEFASVHLSATNMTLLAHREPEPPIRATVAELLTGRLDGRLATVRGEVRDVFPDEIDPCFSYLILSDGDKTVYMVTGPDKARSLSGLDKACPLIGSEVEATGIYVSERYSGLRRHIGRIFWTNSAYPLHIVHGGSKSLFEAPDIFSAATLSPGEVHALVRHRAAGTVLASWHGDSALLRTDNDEIVRLEMAYQKPPTPGGRIETVGFPETDLYHVKLNRAIWREAPGPPQPPEPTTRISVRRLLSEGSMQQKMRAKLHGSRIAFDGIVRGMPAKENGGRGVLESEGVLVYVDFSACPDSLSGMSVGCTVSITGVCVMETESWRPNSVFPQIKGAFLVVTSPDDVLILERTSWWTAGRSLTVIGLLVAVILGVVAWNRSLKSLAERRGRKLLEETVSRITSDLRVGERTTLAVELHDTIAQTLTGVALELSAADKMLCYDLPGAREHLGAAAKTLNSCRTELKNCLFDLRTNALGQNDMNTAIRRAVATVIGDAELQVRFNVPREQITDASAHAIIRIVRELASNAVRHGCARKVKVAGSADDGRLFFSVADDGCGFDPDSAPGIDTCHFGLQGIRERVAKFRGSLSIRSEPGRGTKVDISIAIPNQNKQGTSPCAESPS